jgi:hypothetical protein
MATDNIEYTRIKEAYLQMVSEAKYRPGAPSDGFGNIQLTEEELKDAGRLDAEAHKYAVNFIAEENGLKFHIGISNYDTNRAFVHSIEAARNLCDGKWGAEVALRLLKMAVRDVEQALKQWKK